MRCIECAELTAGGPLCAPCEAMGPDLEARYALLPQVAVERVGCPLNLVTELTANNNRRFHVLANDTRPGRFIHGLPGRGKTRTATSLVLGELQLRLRMRRQDAWWSGVRFHRADELFKLIRSVAFDSSGSISEDDALAMYGDYCQYLVIDDLGSEKISEWSAQTLASLLSMREARRSPTIITSNLNINDIESAYGDPWGAAIASRIHGICDIVEMKGKDWRKVLNG
jgi:DNA replication protein DnaC